MFDYVQLAQGWGGHDSNTSSGVVEISEREFFRVPIEKPERGIRRKCPSAGRKKFNYTRAGHKFMSKLKSVARISFKY